MADTSTPRKDANVFRNVQIKFQLGLVALIALLGFVGIAGIYTMGANMVSAVRHDERTAVAAENLAQEIKYDFLNARRREKDFLLRLDEKYVSQHADQSREILANLDKLKEFHDEASVLELVDGVISGYQAYQRQFSLVSQSWRELGLNEKEGLHGRLRSSVHAVETKLKEFDQPRLAVMMLMMRRHEKDFLARIDPKYLGRMDDRATEFAAGLAESSIPAAEQDAISELMAAYHKDFKALAEIRLATVGQTKALSTIFAEVEPLLTNLVAGNLEDMTTAIENAEELNRTFFWGILSSAGLIGLLVVSLSWFIGSGIAGPIISLSRAMGRLAEKDLETEIPADGWRNEIGRMASAVTVFKANMLENDRLVEEQEREQAERDQRSRLIEDLCQNFDASSSEAVQSVASAASKMRTSSESMSATAEEASRQSAAVAAASEQASANVQTVATAAEELSSSISEIARQVGQASSIASGAVQEAEQTNAKIQGLAEAANKIGEVVALITDIADQTNLLALNATIEAARAGDAGKGFAVVASEVKNLANQTAKATDEIGTQIAGIQTATQDAVGAIESITKTISQIDEVASGIASAVEEQGAATQEIARNVEQAAVGTQEVSSNIVGVSQAANDTGAASSQIRSAAGQLSEQSETLRTAVDKFLAGVRAA